MNKYLVLIFTVFLISACGDDYPLPLLDPKEFANSTDDPKFQQMYAAFSQAPKGFEDSEYTYFYISYKPEAQDRANYLYETLTAPQKKVISLGCENIEFCMQVLSMALDFVIESGRQNEKLLLLPDYLDPPYQKVEEVGFSIKLYNIPNFKLSSQN